MNRIEIDGKWPSLENQILQEMICVEMYYQGELEETANVTFLKVQDKWLSLYFDCEIIFWRNSKSPSQDIEMSELNSHFKSRDIATELEFKNEKIISLKMQDTNPGVDVEFKFENGKSITLYDINDKSNFRT